MSKSKKLLFVLLLLVPVLIVFKNFILSGPLAWGDAPYFFPEALKELASESLVWTQRGINFGGINLLLWISPMMYLYGLLGSVLNLGNNLTIRLIFYFPSLILSLIGPYLLAKHLRFPKLVGFFASLFFVFNTYYLLLIDGGQVGVSVAYGLFPFVILVLSKFIDSVNLKTFWIAISVLMLQIIFDPRITVICFFTFILLRLNKNLLKIWPVIVAAIALSSYWLVPLLGISMNNLSLSVSSLNLSSLLNSLFIFAPHWPANIFGKVAAPYFYFAFVPFLIFGSLFFTKNRKMFYYAFLFLTFAFLAKGTTPPLGEIYNFIITKIPFGTAFRDESKFFIPLILLAGILIGETANILQSKSKIFLAAIYLYLLLLISPALLGKMNFVLSDRNQSSDYRIVYEKLKNQGNIYSAWYPEKSSLGFSTEDSRGIDAKSLVEEKPFASLNIGEDVFNFMHNPEYLNYFRTLGMKYLILADDPRKISLNQEEIKDKENLKSLVATTSGLKKIDWGTKFQIYDIGSVFPKVFKSEKLFAVVGSQLHLSEKNLPAIVYFEDGKLNPEDIINTSSGSTVLVLNKKNILDFTMSFLQKYFIAPDQNVSSGWAIYQPADYLKYKFELLVRGYQFDDFDFGKGIAFSTKKGEILKFKFNVPNAGDYILAQRTGDEKKQNLSWAVEEKHLQKGTFEYEIKNDSEIKVFNIVALIPKDEFNRTSSMVDSFMEDTEVINEKSIQKTVDKNIVEPADFNKINPVNYLVNPDKKLTKGYWLVFTDSYHSLWKLKYGDKYENSVPVYSMVNGFYVSSLWKNVNIVFKGQEFYKKGKYLSIIAFSLIVIVSLVIQKSKKKK